MANEAKQFTIGGVTHDVMDVGARQLITQLQNAINSVQTSLNTLIGSGNVQGAIDTFNEVKAFLDGIDTDDPKLANQLLALNNAITALQTTLSQKANDADVVKSVSVNGTAQSKDTNGNVNIQVQTGSTISPATAAPLEDGTAGVGSSAKYAREDHVHPHDTSKQDKLTFDNTPTADSNNPVKSGGVYTALAGKQAKLTFDNAPTANSNNPVKSGGIYDAIAAMLSQVTVNAIPSGSVAIEDNLASSSSTNALSANMGAALYALIQILFQQINMIEVSEDGLYFIDSNDNIGVYIDGDGLHAINILEHVITE